MKFVWEHLSRNVKMQSKENGISKPFCLSILYWLRSMCKTNQDYSTVFNNNKNYSVLFCKFHDCENFVLQLGFDNTRTIQNWSYLQLKFQQSFWFISPTFFNILLGYVLIHFLHDLWSEVIHDEVQIEEICFPLKLPTLHFDRRVL